MVIDVRSLPEYSKGHIPGSISNAFRGVYATWLGWLAPADTPLLFVTGDVPLQPVIDESLLVGYERFAGWLRQIAMRMSINRAVRRPNETVLNPHTFSTVESAPASPLENLLQAEQAGRVRGGLDRLRELDRRTLIAFYFEGHSLKQMSDEFESPIGTIKRRLHTARNRLREELADLQPA